jgi:hypothetical protein
MDLYKPPVLCTCKACLEGRIIKTPYKGYIIPGKYPDKLIYIDTVGPLYIVKNGTEYFIHFHCNKTKEVEYYTIKYRSELLAKFKLFQQSYYRRIIRLRTDNGGEFVSKAFQLYLTETGVYFEPSVPYNPEMNRAIERIGRILWTIIEILLKSSKFPSK